MFTLRKATRKDASAIRKLIWLVRINPLGLDWRRFLVAVDEQDRVIACGQIKPHHDGTRELASIATHPAWRGQGIASAIIQHLLQETPRPIYLITAAHNRDFYPRFGFRILELPEMPPELARIMRFAAWLKHNLKLFASIEGGVVMGLL